MYIYICIFIFMYIYIYISRIGLPRCRRSPFRPQTLLEPSNASQVPRDLERKIRELDLAKGDNLYIGHLLLGLDLFFLGGGGFVGFAMLTFVLPC